MYEGNIYIYVQVETVFLSTGELSSNKAKGNTIITHLKSQGMSIRAIIEDAALMVTIISVLQHPMPIDILLASYINTRTEIIKKEASQR